MEMEYMNDHQLLEDLFFFFTSSDYDDDNNNNNLENSYPVPTLAPSSSNNNYIPPFPDHNSISSTSYLDPYPPPPPSFQFDFEDPQPVPDLFFDLLSSPHQSIISPTNYCFQEATFTPIVDHTCKLEDISSTPAAEPVPVPVRKTSTTAATGKVKKVSGQPSKNLMAERRRRKRLNDRLSMLRSVVPKISKMDRTSILGDTIDYMKDLLERINTFQQQHHILQLPTSTTTTTTTSSPSSSSSSSSPLSSSSSPPPPSSSLDDELRLITKTIFKTATAADCGDVKPPNEALVRNSPKFEVERGSRGEETRIEICCGGKPGLVLSTVTTLEALGLEIKHCVISCFNDFSLQASCSLSQEMKKRTMVVVDTEDIKQALLRNAGYGGKCL